jgi:hypothetical protein
MNGHSVEFPDDFAKLRKAPMSFMSVCPYVRPFFHGRTWLPLGAFSSNFEKGGEGLQIFAEKIQAGPNQTKITRPKSTSVLRYRHSVHLV